MRIPELEEDFPNLATSPYDPKSPPDAKYNCIAFALGDTSHFWYDADVQWLLLAPRRRKRRYFSGSAQESDEVPNWRRASEFRPVR